MGEGAARSFLDRLEEVGVLIADGATGTSYQQMGLEPGMAPEEWLFEAPDKVLELHRAFVDSGADILVSCSFGATSLRLEDTPLVGRARDVNVRAAELAREAAAGRALVAGSMGPTGRLCEPLGPLDAGTAADAYEEQARALTDGGADLLLLETFFALEEALAAIEGIQRTSDLPLVVTFSFDQGTRTMMGLSAADVVDAVLPLGVAAVGANCGRSLEDNDAVVDEFLAAAPPVPLWVKPNAGVPRMVGDAVVYEADAETLAAHARRYVGRGVRIVGGCCGSTPAHVAAIARAVNSAG